MGQKVLVPQKVVEEGVNYLKELGYEPVFCDGNRKEEMLQYGKDCEAIWLGIPMIDGEVMDAMQGLKIIARQGSGYNNVDVKEAKKRGIWVTNAPDATTNTVAEFALGGMIDLAKKMTFLSEKMRAGDFFGKLEYPGIDLAGKKLAIIGYGKIGREFAKKAHFGLDMEILAYGPHLTQEKAEDYVTVVSWEEAFRQADVVSLHMRLTDQTYHSIGKREFDWMKKGALMINCARGAVLNEMELAEALREGQVGGLFTDVFEEEPPAADHPFLTMEQVLATPHMGFNTKECRIRMALHAVDQIHKVLSGDVPDTPVISLD